MVCDDCFQRFRQVLGDSDRGDVHDMTALNFRITFCLSWNSTLKATHILDENHSVFQANEPGDQDRSRSSLGPKSRIQTESGGGSRKRKRVSESNFLFYPHNLYFRFTSQYVELPKQICYLLLISKLVNSKNKN